MTGQTYPVTGDKPSKQMQSRLQLGTTIPRLIVIGVATAIVVTTIGFAAFLWSCSSCSASLTDWILIQYTGIAIVAAVLGWVFMVSGFVEMIKNMLAMTGHVNDTFQDASWVYRFNRFNLVYAPRYLTEEGLLARKESFRGLRRFILGGVLWIPALLIPNIFV